MRKRGKSLSISFSILIKNKGTSEKHGRVKQVFTMFSCIVKYITPYKLNVRLFWILDSLPWIPDSLIGS